MSPAPRIKSRPTPRTLRLAPHILPNRQLRSASPATNRPRIPLLPRPNGNRMPRERQVAILARIVDPATLHLDRHDIQRRMVMRATRFQINADSANNRRRLGLLVGHSNTKG